MNYAKSKITHLEHISTPVVLPFWCRVIGNLYKILLVKCILFSLSTGGTSVSPTSLTSLSWLQRCQL